MPFILTDAQKVRLEVNPLNKAGNPAKIDGDPVWSSSDPSIITIEATPDPKVVFAVTTGTLGLAQVNVKADADLGAGVREIASVLDVEVIASEAVTLGIQAGTPEDR